MHVYKIVMEKEDTKGEIMRIEKAVISPNFFSVVKHNEENMLDPYMEIVAIYKADTVVATYQDLTTEGETQ